MFAEPHAWFPAKKCERRPGLLHGMGPAIQNHVTQWPFHWNMSQSRRKNYILEDKVTLYIHAFSFFSFIKKCWKLVIHNPSLSLWIPWYTVFLVSTYFSLYYLIHMYIRYISRSLRKSTFPIISSQWQWTCQMNWGKK